jgi:hypothetical protein
VRFAPGALRHVTRDRPGEPYGARTRYGLAALRKITRFYR